MQAPTGLGRSGPRSKTGCQSCKQRRVRCDESRPKCFRCVRTGLDCEYHQPRPRQRRSNRSHPTADGPSLSHTTSISPTMNRPQTPLRNSSRVSLYQKPTTGERQDPPNLESRTPSNTAWSNSSDSSNPSQLSGYDIFGENHLFSQPTIPFPTLGFQEISDILEIDYHGDNTAFSATDSAILAQFWGGGSTETVGTATTIETGPNFETENSGTVDFEFSGKDGKLASEFSLPLSASSRKILLDYFEHSVHPPASLVDMDPLGWMKVKSYLIHMTQGGTASVSNALFALTGLIYVLDPMARTEDGTDLMKQSVSKLEQATIDAIETELSHDDWKDTGNNSLLASLFLLAWFEVVTDDESRPYFPRMIAERVIVGGKNWNSGSRRLLRCLCLMDAKTSHLGGRHLLTDATLDIMMQDKSKVQYIEDASECDNESALTAQVDSPSSISVNPSTNLRLSTKSNRLESLLSDSPPPPPPKFVKLSMFNILLQPALEFHLLSASYCRRIGSQDRHHRTRETVEDEFEVTSICRRLEEELENIWRQRPAILTFTAEQMMALVCEDMARKLEELFSIYLANFWCHFIYIHRVAYWSLKHSKLATKAIKETGRMIRRSIRGNYPLELPESEGFCRTEKIIHPGLMWACFMFGCETPDPVGQDWAISQLRALGELGDKPDLLSGQDMIGLPPSRLDRKGAQNALRVSILLKAQVERQTRQKCRVDGKILAKELFGCHFYII